MVWTRTIHGLVPNEWWNRCMFRSRGSMCRYCHWHTRLVWWRCRCGRLRRLSSNRRFNSYDWNV